MALFSYPVCTWLCQYVNMGVRKWLEKSAEKQKYKMRKTANPLSRKAFRAVSFSATKDMRSVLIGSEYPAKALRILFTSIATENARLCGGLTIMSEHYEQLPHHREFSLTICFFYCIMLQVIWNKLCASVAQR